MYQLLFPPREARLISHRFKCALEKFVPSSATPLLKWVRFRAKQNSHLDVIIGLERSHMKTNADTEREASKMSCRLVGS
jgi:hypothetical protein